MSTAGKGKNTEKTFKNTFHMLGEHRPSPLTLVYEFSVLKFWGPLNPHPGHLWTVFELGSSLIL